MGRALVLIVVLVALAALTALPLNENVRWAAFVLFVLTAYWAGVTNRKVPTFARIVLFLVLLALCAITAVYGATLAEEVRLISVVMGAWLIALGTAHTALAVGRWARSRRSFASTAQSVILSIVVGAAGAALAWGFLFIMGEDFFEKSFHLLQSREIVTAFIGGGIVLSLILTVSGWFGAKHESVGAAGAGAIPPVPFNQPRERFAPRRHARSAELSGVVADDVAAPPVNQDAEAKARRARIPWRWFLLILAPLALIASPLQPFGESAQWHAVAAIGAFLLFIFSIMTMSGQMTIAATLVALASLLSFTSYALSPYSPFAAPDAVIMAYIFYIAFSNFAMWAGRRARRRGVLLGVPLAIGLSLLLGAMAAFAFLSALAAQAGDDLPKVGSLRELAEPFAIATALTASLVFLGWFGARIPDAPASVGWDQGAGS